MQKRILAIIDLGVLGRAIDSFSYSNKSIIISFVISSSALQENIKKVTQYRALSFHQFS